MINYGDVTKENIIEYNLNYQQILGYPYRILIIGGYGFGKTVKIHMKQNINILLENTEKFSENLKNPKAFIEYSNKMQDVYKNIEEYKTSRKCNVLKVFDDMIAVLIDNKKLGPIVTELFIRGGELNISTVFIAQFYFQVPEDVRLNCKHFVIKKIPKKQRL